MPSHETDPNQTSHPMLPLASGERQSNVNAERELIEHGVDVRGSESGLSHVPMAEVARIARERQQLLHALKDALQLIDTEPTSDTERRKGEIALLLAKLQ